MFFSVVSSSTSYPSIVPCFALNSGMLVSSWMVFMRNSTDSAFVIPSSHLVSSVIKPFCSANTNALYKSVGKPSY